jgi:uncharacterized protein (TIGR02611 family)
MVRRPNIKELYKKVTRLITAAIGFTVLLIGVVMIVTPGPSILVILLGLGILAAEFVWAERLLKRLRGQLKDITILSFRRSKRG